MVYPRTHGMPDWEHCCPNLINQVQFHKTGQNNGSFDPKHCHCRSELHSFPDCSRIKQYDCTATDIRRRSL